MEFLELKDISEQGMELINPISPEKIIAVGRMANLTEKSRIIEFGSGYGEVLALWAEHFGISGIGVEVRPAAHQRAQHKMIERGLSDRIQLVCQDAAQFLFEPQGFDVAACIGSTFIWDGFQPTLRQMRKAITDNGRLIVGEPYWRTSNVAPEYAYKETGIHSEYELLCAAREEGCEFEYMVRANCEDWDRYQTENWQGLIQWIKSNPDHAERAQVIAHLHESQDEYTRYGSQYLGWAVYILNPLQYQ